MASSISEVLTIAETAELLNLERHAVGKLISAGVIPSIRLSPRVIRVPRRLLLETLESMASSVRTKGGTDVQHD